MPRRGLGRRTDRRVHGGDCEEGVGMRTRALGCVRLTVVAAALSMLGGTLAMAADTPDPWITMKTKIALMTTEDVSTKDLNVDTVKGVVTLHGMVATDAEKGKAEEVAMKVGGVKAVKNLLQVVPSARREIVERADAAYQGQRRVSVQGEPSDRRQRNQGCLSQQRRGAALGKDEVVGSARRVCPSRVRGTRRATGVNGGRGRFAESLESAA
jgi:hyperosmotically inducible protein